jgi:hypothetical protein
MCLEIRAASWLFDQLISEQFFYRSLGQSVAGSLRRSQPLAVRQR